ncbi:MAG: biopolymer transporter ExbD [Acidobacteria bacterium]|nr:biopolymer transporter ExbD [Acidobacteriota bacterium]
MKRREATLVSDINVTPMVDVMLVMLIIFMVITPMLTKGITVELVKTKNPVAMADADKEDAILVAVSRDGRLYLGSTQVTNTDALVSKVKDMLTNKIQKIAYLKADSRARYEKVVELVDAVRSAGVDTMGLLTESSENKVNVTKAPGGM